MNKGKQKILVVDDERLNRNVLSELFSEKYHIIIAKNGRQALERIKKTDDIDLILLDIMMPEMDGYTVLKLLKDKDLIKNIPVIFITALDSDVEEEKGLQLGACDYITKPFNPHITRLRVENHLQLVRQQKMLGKLVSKLEKTLEEVKTLKGILPICSFCKKIRDDKGYWNQLESYVQKHTEAEFSHGLCQACANKHYPGMNLDED